MKILLTGHCSSFFITPWVAEIKKTDPNLDFSVLGLNNPAGEITPDEKELFSNIYEQESSYTTIIESKLQILRSYIQDKGIGTVLKKIFSFKTFKNAVIDHYWQRKKEKWAENILLDKDLVFVHYLSLGNIEFIKYVKPETKLILCFWGSDLLQESSEETLLALKPALKRADLISVQNHGMRFICCTKYGWDLKSKIRMAPFYPNYKLFNQINSISKEASKLKLGQLFGITTDKIWLSCGYRPIPIVQQAEIITVLGQLPTALKKDVVLILTMNYSTGNSDYVASILQAAKNANIEYVIIDRYLDDEELAEIRKAMDIFIHLPVTDAMSATLLEHLYAGNFVVTSSVLPYGLFRKHALEYKEVDELEELKDIIESALLKKNFLNEENKLRIDQMLSKHFSINNWLKIIHE